MILFNIIIILLNNSIFATMENRLKSINKIFPVIKKNLFLHFIHNLFKEVLYLKIFFKKSFIIYIKNKI